MPARITRRDFLTAAAGAGLLACGVTDGASGLGSARLGTRPHGPGQTVTPGIYPLGRPETDGYDGYLLVPPSYDPQRPLPLVVSLHGAGGGPSGPIGSFGPYAESGGFILIAPQSRGGTWDAIDGAYGPDIGVLDGLLEFGFDHCAIDPARVYLQGFSDGASYALGLGRANGDLFRRVIAFSPGLVPRADTPDHGTPGMFLSHGRFDAVLSFNRTATETVPALRQAGYVVEFIEFDGGHTVPVDVADQAFDWLLR